MKLYESPSPNARRVHVFMAEKGIEIDRVAVDLRSAENLSEEFLAKNPAGRVPVLELDDGTFISESLAICRYLEGMNPEPNLFGEGALGTAMVEMWSRRVELNFLMNVAMGFRNISGFFKDRETCVEEWGHVSAQAAAKSVSMFDERLGQSRYLAGESFSVADITFAIAWDFAGRVKVIDLPEANNVARWLAEVNERASMSAT